MKEKTYKREIKKPQAADGKYRQPIRTFNLKFTDICKYIPFYANVLQQKNDLRKIFS